MPFCLVGKYKPITFAISLTTKAKNMTQFQKIKDTYAKGNKSMAYLAFKADESSLDKTFEQFCEGMDRIIKMGNSKPTMLHKKNINE